MHRSRRPLTSSAAGDEIVVQSGVYTEALTLRDQITIRGAESGHADVDSACRLNHPGK